MDGSEGRIPGLIDAGWSDGEARRLARLIEFMLQLADPPDTLGVFQGFGPLRYRLARSIGRDEAEVVEERFLELYAYLHMNHAPYSEEERRRMNDAG